MSQRKGARSFAEITPKLRAQLSRGEVPSVTLSEMLAADFSVLLPAVEPSLPRELLNRVTGAGGIVARMNEAGRVMAEHFGASAAVERLSAHTSDIVRGWAAYAVACVPGLSAPKALKLIRPLADDSHSGVREWAWMAVRPVLAADLDRSIKLLTPWTIHASPNIRRFATEATRPRGVWCAHITALRHDPSLGLPLLEPLKADPTKYVQDSVSNWLNDAAKDNPKFVRDLCREWLRGKPAKSTERICRRAVRSIS